MAIILSFLCGRSALYTSPHPPLPISSNEARLSSFSKKAESFAFSYQRTKHCWATWVFYSTSYKTHYGSNQNLGAYFLITPLGSNRCILVVLIVVVSLNFFSKPSWVTLIKFSGVKKTSNSTVTSSQFISKSCSQHYFSWETGYNLIHIAVGNIILKDFSKFTIMKGSLHSLLLEEIDSRNSF